MLYTVYHLPQLKKVGCTKRFEARMREQDIPPPYDDYIKFKSSDIEEASLAEELLREFYNYKKDSPMTYLEKFSSKKIANTGESAVFKSSNTPSVGWNELHIGATKDQLRDDLNRYDKIVLSADGKEFQFGPDDYDVLVKKAKTSQYKDFYWQVTTLQAIQDAKKDLAGPCGHQNVIPEFQQIRDWATERGIYSKGDAKTQYLKLQEEAGEVARAILKQDEPEIIDGLGDTLVVLINLAHLAGYRLEDCLQSAYDVISKRKGKMINGTFVKQESL